MERLAQTPTALGQSGVTDLDSALRRALAGDEAAFRALYRDMQPRLLRYVSALVGADAEDVASETWLQVARDLKSFHGSHDDFRGWVATIGRHRATDHLRRASRRPRTTLLAEEYLGLASADDTATSALEMVSTAEAVALIARLPTDQAEAVLLRVVVGLDAKTAAQVLGKRPGAVRTAAYRGLRRLSEYLDMAEEEGSAGLRWQTSLARPGRHGR